MFATNDPKVMNFILRNEILKVSFLIKVEPNFRWSVFTSYLHSIQSSTVNLIQNFEVRFFKSLSESF